MGMHYRQEDMPFTKDGLVPDIIMNPHAVPSRMTIAQLMECLLGKACTSLGTYGDASPFTDLTVEDIAKVLQSQGLERYGNEILYNPRTGEQIDTLIFFGPTFYQRLKHMTVDKQHCYDPDTEVLTNLGWIKFNKLTKEHKVASMVNEALVYQNPIELQEFDYTGKMYKMDTEQVNLLVTPNHRMYVRGNHSKTYGLITAEEMYGKRKVWKRNVNMFEPDVINAPVELIFKDKKVISFRIPDTDMVFDIKSWLIFFGIWVAEGYVCKYDYTIKISAEKQRVKDALTLIEKDLGVNFLKRPDGSTDKGKIGETNSWRIYKASMGRYMLPFSVGAVNKFLPEWVWFLDRDNCKHLIEGMCLGDGCKLKKGKGNWTYSTSSTRLADDFQRLCLHSGVSCNKRLHSLAGTTSYSKVIGKPITSTVDSWQLVINTCKNEPCINHRPHNPRQDVWEDYSGKVYCCTVPKGDGVIYVRKNGISVWCGNSRSSNGPVVKYKAAKNKCQKHLLVIVVQLLRHI
jgi:hypothetical protein